MSRQSGRASCQSGLGLKTVKAPASRPLRSATRVAEADRLPCIRRMSPRAMTSPAASRATGLKARAQAVAETMAFSPSSRTSTTEVSVGNARPARCAARPGSRPISAESAAASSRLTAAWNSTAAPARAAATAWFNPLPPSPTTQSRATSVSPGTGNRATVSVVSRQRLPIT